MTAAPSGLIYTAEFVAVPEERGAVDPAAFHPQVARAALLHHVRSVLTSAR